MTTSTNKKTDEARPQMEPLLTVEDLERLLRVNRRTIVRWCKRGTLPAPLKLGGSNRWKAEEITQALERPGERKGPASKKQKKVKPVAI